MKILTYNIWDSPAGMPARKSHIRETLRRMRSDTLCLQEIPDCDTAQDLANTVSCPYLLHNPESGNAILSMRPFLPAWQYSYASAVLLKEKTYTIQIVNVHLPWDSAVKREEAILRINRQAKKQNAHYTILAGDFNGTDKTDVHRFLTGESSLQGSDAYYFDLALAYGARHGSIPGMTLDFQHNPRWGVYEPVNTLEASMRCDRIYLSNPYPDPLPTLQDFGVFGTETDPETGLCPSDHYGVYADLQF